MKTGIKKWALVAMAAILLLSLPNFGSAAGSAGDAAIADGEYLKVPYTYLADGTSGTSAADSFMQVIDSGRLVVAGGKATFYHKIQGNFAGWIKSLAYRKAGQPKATIVNDVVSNDGGYESFGRTVSDVSTGQVEVSVPVESLTSDMDILMHVVVPPGNGAGADYDHWYNAQLHIDTKDLPLNSGEEPGGETPVYTLEQLNGQISNAQSVYNAAVVGDAYGQYSALSKELFEIRIGTARDAANNANSNPSGVTPAYLALTNALSAFKASVKQADKTALKAAMAKVQGLYDKVQAAGEAGKADAAARAALNGDSDPSNDVETYVLKAVTAGEYKASTGSALKSALNSAQTALDNPTTPDATVAARVNTLNARYDSNSENYFRLLPEPLPIYVLDNATSAGAQSEYASDFAGIAFRLSDGKFTEYANLPMNIANVSEAYASVPMPHGELELPQEGQPGYKAIKLVSFGDYTKPVYQVRSGSDNESMGLSFLSYKVGDQKRTVYISYNYNELKRLNDRIAAAQSLHAKAQDAEAGKPKATTLAAESLDALESAIDEAKETGNNLAASRQQIAQANVTLKAAVASFIERAPYTTSFTVADAASDDFSAAGAYVGDQADITAANGTTYAEFTVENSSKVTAVRVNNGTGLVDAQAIGEDAQANTRRVKIEIPDPAALTTVQIVADGATYDARLNFNDVDNKALAAKVAAAKSELTAAVAGTAIGQYPASAKTALEQAVAAAAKEAVRLSGTQTLTDSAVQTLDAAIRTFRAAVNVTGGSPGNGTELADGKYQISFTILKQGTTQASVMDEYVAHPGRMLVENGTKYVYIWLNKSKEITAFTVNGSSAETVTSDAAGNTRWVRFPVSNLSALQSGWVKIDWPEVNYFHQYDVQIQLGSYTKVSEWSGEGFGAVTDRPNPDGEEEDAETDEEGNGGGTSGGTDENLGAEFFDTAKHWAAASISRAVKLGIVNGYADGNFRPNAAISRVEFAVLLGRALNLQGEEGDETELSFKDASDVRPWAQSFIKQAVAAGIIGGFEDGSFRPAKEISRPELAVMIVRALGLAPDADASIAFADAPQIPAYARPYVATAVKLGLIQGGSNNRFGAKSPATRAEAITLVLRALDYAEANAKAKAGAEADGAKAGSEAANG